MANNKYKGVSKDKNGNIYYQTEFSKDPITGKRRRVKSYKDKNGNPFKSEKQAFDELCRIRVEYNKLAEAKECDLTFVEFMDDVFLPYYSKIVQGSTYRTAQPAFDLCKKRFPKKKLVDITVRDCESFRIYLQENFSPNYARGVWSRFKKVLGYAERLEYIDDFPCGKLDNIKGERSQTEFWTFEDFQKIVSSFDVTTYDGRYKHMIVWLYFMTGLRVSEGLSLIWSDIDLSKKLLHVQSTLEDLGNGSYVRKERTKTESGMRFIELDDMTTKILEAWREIQVNNQDSDFVLARMEVPLHKTTLTRILQRQAKIVGVPAITGKGLRHSHDSFMINELGKDVLFVAARSGRVDKATTLNTYSHIYASKKATGGNDITNYLVKSGLRPHQDPTNYTI
ncbi:tyrosine-type recombinase/integrase [Streptococcus suis]|uniref:tyrosine-type recombinase/integrase n=1 Tax=Streptococcus suis TaxID=1307 RepID=UPI00211D9AFB|nr:site-specific integrase [Streptococcus suis]UUM58108.1 site-specific integrase [Streptococcus suis]